MYADGVERMNRVELSLSKMAGPAAFDEWHYKLAMMTARIDSISTHVGQPTEKQPDVNAQFVTAATPMPERTEHSADVVHVDTRGERSHESTSQTHKNTGVPHHDANAPTTHANMEMPQDKNTELLCVTFNNDSDSTERKTKYKPDYQSADELSGFMPVKGRTRFTPMFVAGIMIKNENIDETVKCVSTHLEKRGCHAKSVRKVKDSGETMSVKILVNQNDIETILDNGFWPKGIYCRLWIN
jgi:hypothetical protein